MTDAVIVHWIPGPIRLRISERRREAVYFSSLEALLREIEDVASVKANPATASVVVRFTGSGQSLLDRLRELDLQPRLQSDTPRRRGTSVQPIRLTTGRDIDPMFMAGTALAVVGLVQTFRGKLLFLPSRHSGTRWEAFATRGRIDNRCQLASPAIDCHDRN